MLSGSWFFFFFFFFLSDCDMSSGLLPSLTELTHWPITNSFIYLSFLTAATGAFLVVILLQFVLYCCSCCWHFPLMDKHDRSPLLFLLLSISFRLPLLFFFCRLILLILSLSPPTKSSRAHVYNVFYLIFLLSPLISVLSIFKCLMFCPFFLLFFCSFHPYAALFCWCMEHIWCLDSCG